jgi:Flp pilus assembly protein TadD
MRSRIAFMSRQMIAASAGAWVVIAAMADHASAAERLPTPLEKAEASLPEAAKAERAVVRSPDDREIRLRAARAQLAAGADESSHVESAQQHALAVLANHPADIDALLMAGQTSLLKGDATAAARYYRAATSSHSSNAAAFLGLGDALTRLGDETGATAAFSRYRELQGMPPLTGSSAQK